MRTLDDIPKACDIAAGDINISEHDGLSERVEIWEDEDVAARFPEKEPDSHKGDYGSVAVLAGYGSFGAPLLSAGAALKSGAGYTHLLLPCSESRETDEMRRAVFSAKYPACIVNFYADAPVSARAIAFGMGASVGSVQYETLAKLLKSPSILLLDADALNALSAYGKDILKEHGGPVILTPHPVEFSRLTGKSVGEILSDPIGCAKAFASEYGVVVALKNYRTVITDGVRTAVNTTGSPALAKGGSGDVLSGLIAGTAARGVPPFEAACVGSYLLGRAGEIAGREMGQYAPDATDIIARIPAAILSVSGYSSREPISRTKTEVTTRTPPVTR